MVCKPLSLSETKVNSIKGTTTIMTISEISIVLGLIDEWTQALDDEDLNEQCRQSGRDFFQFMKSRGINAALMAKLIIDATGYNPARLWRIEDAGLLRDAIFRYEGSIAVTRIDEKDGIPDAAEDNVKRFWGEDVAN